MFKHVRAGTFSITAAQCEVYLCAQEPASLNLRLSAKGGVNI